MTTEYQIRDEVTGEEQGPYSLDEAKLRAIRLHRATGNPVAIQSSDRLEPDIAVTDDRIFDGTDVRDDADCETTPRYRVRDETSDEQGFYASLDEVKLQALRLHRRTGNPVAIQEPGALSPDVVVMDDQILDKPDNRTCADEDAARAASQQVDLTSNELVTDRVIARLLGASTDKIDELVQNQQIPFVRVEGKGIRFCPREVDAAFHRPLPPAVTTR